MTMFFLCCRTAAVHHTFDILNFELCIQCCLLCTLKIFIAHDDPSHSHGQLTTGEITRTSISTSAEPGRIKSPFSPTGTLLPPPLRRLRGAGSRLLFLILQCRR